MAAKSSRTSLNRRFEKPSIWASVSLLARTFRMRCVLNHSLEEFVRKSRGVEGIYSVCSAHPWVIEAAMRQTKEDGSLLLLEATSNQVNQMGGYTGMTPAQFRDYAFQIARHADFAPERLILGGDHLGPNPWQEMDAKSAMARATEMVRAYVNAGFSKIHLDASMRCSDDPPILPEQLMAERAAILCQAAEAAPKQDGSMPTIYVIGTEVPTPGGSIHAMEGLDVTSCEAAERTLTRHSEAFFAAGLHSAWHRVVALVVQPGVEFDHDSVVDYDAAKANHLQHFLQAHPELVMEAHSTDYQRPQAYVELIRDGFSILKVGPALTFALRETLFSLAAMEREICPDSQSSHLAETIEKVMLAHPEGWQKYYGGPEETQRLLRVYSYSDRMRYYWKFPEIAASVTKLILNLRHTGIPETMLSQYCPLQYAEIRAGKLQNDPQEVVIAGIRAVLRTYSLACQGKNLPRVD